jgi:hypothetical protein
VQVSGVVRSPGVILTLSLGLAVLYGLVIVVWYELLRSTVMDRLRRRRRDDVHAAGERDGAWEGVRSAERGGAPADQALPEEVELDRARRHHYLARQAAKAERDAAIWAASDAAGEAIERIDRRYREIDAALIDEETKRISQMLGRHSSDGREGLG